MDTETSAADDVRRPLEASAMALARREIVRPSVRDRAERAGTRHWDRRCERAIRVEIAPTTVASSRRRWRRRRRFDGAGGAIERRHSWTFGARQREERM